MDTSPKQTTLKSRARLDGVALHTGLRARLTAGPAEPGTGILFRRLDLPGAPAVRAAAANVVDARRATTIQSGPAVVHTVEHAMAAFHALGVDNAIVEMDGPEPPIMDGSAAPFVEMILEAGIQELDAAPLCLSPAAPAVHQMGDTKIAAFPDDKLRITCVIDFGSSATDAQALTAVITPDYFRSFLAPARTFVLYKELKQLIGMGLVKGGGLENALVMHDGAVYGSEPLRFPDELVRHKIMDIVGDLFLCGSRVKAHVVAYKPGHPSNVALAKLILEQRRPAAT